MQKFSQKFILILILCCLSCTGHATPSLDSIQKFYSMKNWDVFFAKVIFFRIKNKNGSRSEFDHVLALELMGLARHCQWQIIDKLSASYQHSKNGRIGPLSQRVLSAIQVKQEYLSYREDRLRENRNNFRKIKDSKGQWSISPENVSKLTSSMHLRVKVESLCEA